MGNRIKNYLYKKYGWIIKAWKSKIRVTQEGDIYLEPKPLKERYFKIAEESGMTELEDYLFKK